MEAEPGIQVQWGVHDQFNHSLVSLGVQSRGGYPLQTLQEADYEDDQADGEAVNELDEFSEPEESPDASPSVEPDEMQLLMTTWVHRSLSELASLFTVTSKKFEGATLGRKRKSIEERNAPVAVHHVVAVDIGLEIQNAQYWPKATRKARAKASLRRMGDLLIELPFMVTYGDEGQDQPDTFYTFPANLMVDVSNVLFVYVTETIDLAGYMVLGTACQRSCAGSRWMNTHQKLLANHGLHCHQVRCDDRFQFGQAIRCYFPAAFSSQETQGVVLGSSVLDVNIPFLASRVLMEFGMRH